MERNKTLSYRRAEFLSKKEGMKTLEKYLNDAHSKLKTIAERKIEGPGHPTLECRKHQKKDKLGTLLHIAAYTPGEQASVVPHEAVDVTGDIKTTAPPKESDFMDGDIMALVVGNHVLLCATNLHEKKIQRYMMEIMEKAGIDKEGTIFGLTRVADINRIKLIEAQGVRSVNIEASLYDASIDHLERTTVTQKLGGGFMDHLKAFFSEDKTLVDLDEAENLSAHITLNFDSRRKGKTLGRERLESVAKQLLGEDDDEGFSIQTLTGEKIKGSSITLRKPVTLPKLGKSVYRTDAWKALEEYYYELKDNGLLEQ